jgi:arylsulfatase
MRVSFSQDSTSPNIIIIITDDQGYGDFGFTGNPHVKTPVLDRLAKESIRFNNFYVSPVCAPTRSSLMTGRYSLRTGVRDTYNGGATMASGEVTLAEILKQANYKTGIFGKWHLGDNYPSRPMDQGFDESVTHLAGGMGQVGDVTTYFQRDSSYYDPVLWHNGQQESYKGYCSDIFADEAMNFIEANHNNPFFCYLSFNAPHTPLQVPDKYYQMYRDIDPSDGFDKDESPFIEMSEKNKEDARKVYAMVTNIDDNVGKLLSKLETLKISENTLVLFMTDNGPQQVRYIAGMRGRKGSVYRGGVRVPCLVKYPDFVKDKEIETTAAHIDILPTIADLCNIALPQYTKMDGKSLLPLMLDKEVNWAERSLFFYWTRRYPELYNNISLQKGSYKLVGHTSYDSAISDFELFDIQSDPYEQNNLVNENKSLAESLKKELDATFAELINSKNLTSPPLIEIGNIKENPIILNRNDAGGERGIWAQEEIYGKWDVKINAGVYNIKFKFIEPLSSTGTMLLETGTIVNRKEYSPENEDLIEMKNVVLPEMKGEVVPYYFIKRKKIFPFWVEFEKIR